MEVCRVCLSKGPDKDILHLKTTKKEGYKSPSEILHFCLGIMMDEDSKITKKLCTKCFKKIITYYKFKVMALRSDEILKTTSLDGVVKLEPVTLDCDDGDDNCDVDFLNETGDVSLVNEEHRVLSDIKEEPNAPQSNYDSDDEILSTLKRLKSEDGEIKSDENIFISIESAEDIDYNIKELFDSDIQDNIKSKKEKNPSRVKLKRRIKPAESKLQRIRKSGAKKRDSNGKIAPDLNYRVICEECGKSVRNIKEHMVTHLPDHMKKSILCKYSGCDKRFATHGSRYKHYKRVHLGIKDHCDICNKEFASLSTHKKQMHAQESLGHRCMFCDKGFVSQSALDLHVGMHTKSRPHTCEHCGNSYRTPMSLRNHIRAVHNKEKSHTCQCCDKKFFKKCHLDVHMRKSVHLKEKNYKCEYCSKAFYGKAPYKIHLRSHTKEKPYACTICDMRFGNSTTLKNHKFTHKTTKDIHCTLCSMSFVRSDYLRAHMLTHTKVKKYPCKYCGVSFGRSDHRNRHQFTAHEKNMPYVAERASNIPQQEESEQRLQSREDDTDSVEEKLPFDVNSVGSV